LSRSSRMSFTASNFFVVIVPNSHW